VTSFVSFIFSLLLIMITTSITIFITFHLYLCQPRNTRRESCSFFSCCRQNESWKREQPLYIKTSQPRRNTWIQKLSQIQKVEPKERKILRYPFNDILTLWGFLTYALLLSSSPV
jgi:hypothetical protein